MEMSYSHVPNALSFSRIVLAALFPFVSWEARVYILVLAGLTEFLDGFLARRFGFETIFGQILDPAADKIFALSVGLTLVASHHLTLPELVLVLSRDIVVALGAMSLAVMGRSSEIKDFRPNGIGKWATAFQYIFFLLATRESKLEIPFMVFTAFFSAVAAVKYIQDFTALLGKLSARRGSL